MPLRVLLVEDSPVDAVLVERALARGALEAAVERVETPEGLTAALQRAAWDVVLSDYSMPGWSGLDALALVRKMAPDLPFILVSGTIGEDIAVQAMQSGASDYLLKDRLTRLPAAVRRAREDAELRREHARSRVALAFLAQASDQLARSLDPVAIAETLVALVVPLLADAAAVHVAEDDGTLRRAAVSDLEPGAVWTTWPLVVHGALIGTVTLGRSGERAATALVDDAVVPELAARAAVALQNARLFARAETAVALRNEFLQVAAHELRTPLTPLALQVESLRRRVRAAGTAGEATELDTELAATSRHVRRLTSLVDRLLDVSELGLGAPRLACERSDLAALVREVVGDQIAAAAEVGSVLTVDAAGPLVATFDRGRIAEAVQNLVANAIKFGAGAPIAVTLAAAGGTARLVVRDAGPGIAPTDRERIFERFGRATSLRRYGGFGVGLWMARAIVAAHGGRIAVASAPGPGATFSVELPLTPHVGASTDQPPAPTQN